MSWLPGWSAPAVAPIAPSPSPGWADDEPTGSPTPPPPRNGWEALTESGTLPGGGRYWQVPGYVDRVSIDLAEVDAVLDFERVRRNR